MQGMHVQALRADGRGHAATANE